MSVHMCLYASVAHVPLRPVRTLYTQRSGSAMSGAVLHILLPYYLFYVSVYSCHFCNFLKYPLKWASTGFMSPVS